MMKNDNVEGEPAYDETYRRGPVVMRGPMIPKDNTYANLLAPEDSTDWLHADPWRAPALLQTVLRVFPAGPPGCSCPKNPVRRVSPPHGVKVCRLARGSSCPRLYQVVTTLPRCTLPNKSIRI